MEPKQNFSRTTLLLLVGLMIGSIGTHLYLNSLASKNNEQITTHLQYLNQTVTGLKMDLNSTMSKITQLETIVTNQRQQIETNEANLIDVTTQVSSLNSHVALIEEKYKILDAENNGNIVQVRELKEQVSNLYNELGLPEGYVLYLDHDIKFEYPGKMNVTERGLSYNYATNLGGIFIGSIVDGNHIETMATEWQYDYLGYLKNNIQGSLESIVLTGYGFSEIQTGELKQMTLHDHVIYYKDFTGVIKGQILYGRVAVWFCEVGNREHELLFYTDSVNYDTVFMSYLDSYRCHK